MAAMAACDGRFTDAWVVDRTLFEYINQGSCSCCGASHAMMDIGSLMHSCSDIETDDGRRERQSPWPAFMAAEVWADRVKLRKQLKGEMAEYQRWWTSMGVPFTAWWQGLTIERKRRMTSLPSDDVMDMLQHQYNMRTAYMTVLCAVNEQVKNFAVTGMKCDSRAEAEMKFEEALQFKRGAYAVAESFLQESGFTDLCAYLGKAEKLLPRAAGRTVHEADDEGQTDTDGNQGAEADEPSGGGGGGEMQSFRADRRLLRILIARHFFKVARSNYAKEEQSTT